MKEERAERALGWGIRFFLAAALTASQLPDGGAPFALGCVAASGAGAEGMAALLGTGVGLVLFSDFSSGLAHLAAAILICTAAAAFREARLMKRPAFFPVCAAGIFLSVRLIYVLQSAAPMTELFPCLTATVLVGVSARWYRPLLTPGQEELDPRALRFLGVTLLAALAEWTLAGVSLGRLLISCLVLVTAWQRGTAAGMTTGLCSGVLMDLCADTGGLFFTAAYGIAGLAAGLCAGRNRLAAAAAYTGAVVLLMMSVTDAQGRALLAETALSALLFVLIPGRAFGGKRLQKAAVGGSAPALDSLKARLSKTAEAFHDLYDSLGRNVAHGTEENPAVVFDRAAEKVCRNCSLCSLCWKKEYVSTFNALNDATPFLLERGRGLPKDFPKHFADRCIHLTEFLGAVNAELSAFLLRQQYRRQLEEARSSARGQYAQVGELLSATAAGLGEARTVAAAAERPYRIGAALRPKEGETVCGDSVSSFETDGGKLCLLLADGSGSGEGARKESALTIRLLRQFLEAGIEPEPALKTLNTALTLRGEESGSFSTIDLMTVELRSGSAALYKYGAAPTYLKKGGSVRRITGNALPAGLRGAAAAPDVTRLSLESGCFAVMISDGVTDASNDEWLQNLLAGWDGDDPQKLAGLVLQESVQREKLADDCGIQVLYLPPSGEIRPI